MALRSSQKLMETFRIPPLLLSSLLALLVGRHSSQELVARIRIQQMSRRLSQLCQVGDQFSHLPVYPRAVMVCSHAQFVLVFKSTFSSSAIASPGSIQSLRSGKLCKNFTAAADVSVHVIQHLPAGGNRSAKSVEVTSIILYSTCFLKTS